MIVGTLRGGANEYPQSMFWRKKIAKIGIALQTLVFFFFFVCLFVFLFFFFLYKSGV